jgi:hypothetical protein
MHTRTLGVFWGATVKTVFILGAGASYAAGAPLMAGFLKTAKELNAANRFGVSTPQIRDVLDAAYKDLKPVLAKAQFTNLTNIEELFSAIDIGELIGSFGNRPPASIAGLRKAIVVFITRTIEETITVPHTATSITPPGDYDMLSKLVRAKIEKTAGLGRNDIAFITFNYDTCLEYGLVRRTLGVDYGLNEPFIDQAEDRYQLRVPVLKLHGSINWARCPKCAKIVPTEIDPWRNATTIELVDTPVLRLNLGSRIAGKQHSCGTPLDPEPVIVPPTWNKSASTGGLETVWRRAAAEIGSAENIIVIGYSFPKTDMFFKYLFALGSHSDTHLESFTVINGPNSGAVKAQFANLLGPMSSEGFKYYEFLLSGSAHIVKEILER